MLRILVIDDNPGDRLLVTRELNREFTNVHIEQIVKPEDLAQILESFDFDVVITDYQLLWSDGLTVLRTLKQRYPDCPVIMFTNSGNQEVAVEAMKAGLEDYVIKSPKNYIRLTTSVRLALERAEERRRASRLEIRLQSLLNRLDVGVFRSSLDGRLLEANAVFLQFLGVNTLSEGQSLNLHELFFQPPEQFQLLAQLQQEGQLHAREARLCRADSTAFWVSWNMTLNDIDGETFIDGLVEDITKYKQIEEALRQKAEELGQANRLKDEFLATLSHELRTPLNSILGWSQMLRSRNMHETIAARALEKIERNAKLQAQLVDDILDVSHIISGRLHLEVYPTDLIPAIEAALKSVRPAAEAKAIRLESFFDSSVGMVVGDSNRLQQMVWNLLSNAIKFTPEGGEVEVRLERVGSHAQIRVTDTGIGIRADFLPYVFDRFSQADSSTTRKFGGLGMGLAMVRHLVELHGGTVRVESSGEGQGATFTVKLPLVTERIEGSSSKQSAPMVKDGLTLGDNCLLDGLRVLVVDDEPDVCELLAVVFDRYGAEVTAVTSAAEALEAIKQSIPDLLVSDIGMPDEDGYALMRKVRSLELELEGRVSAFNEAIPLAKRQEVQAIALTAYASEEDRQKAVEAGFQMHVSKPVEPDVLVAVVAQLTGRTFFEELSG